MSCRGESSCSNTVIEAINTPLDCHSGHSCANLKIYATSRTELNSHLSGYNATFYGTSSHVSFHFRGFDSGQDASVFCLSNHTCTIACYSNGCNNLKTIQCIDNYNDNSTNNYNINSNNCTLVMIVTAHKKVIFVQMVTNQKQNHPAY